MLLVVSLLFLVLRILGLVGKINTTQEGLIEFSVCFVLMGMLGLVIAVLKLRSPKEYVLLEFNTQQMTEYTRGLPNNQLHEARIQKTAFMQLKSLHLELEEAKFSDESDTWYLFLTTSSGRTVPLFSGINQRHVQKIADIVLEKIPHLAFDFPNQL
ncbi:MAG: hypothetical protein ACKO34_00265 [Vampirovibrionales bacterium]